MASYDDYRRQVALLLRLLPHVAQEDCFALKGGTAINLFVRNMPRLSVDIDLTFLPLSGRAESLRAIDSAMRRIAQAITRTLGRQVRIAESKSEDAIVKLFVRDTGVLVKIEVTPVLRGCVFEPELRSVSPAVEAEFGYAEARVVSFADLYAGKIVAALDRQHPRDFFDVRDLLATEGITDALRTAFIVYLISHNRPMAELLAPRYKSLEEEFSRSFIGMTSSPVEPEELTAARDQLLASVVGGMPEAHRRFLLSFKRGEPDWAALGVAGISDLPAVRWRAQNLDQLSEVQRAALLARLQKILF
jgi:predicted nucleotidyltransferase component of viral defense system